MAVDEPKRRYVFCCGVIVGLLLSYVVYFNSVNKMDGNIVPYYKTICRLTTNVENSSRPFTGPTLTDNTSSVVTILKRTEDILFKTMDNINKERLDTLKSSCMRSDVKAPYKVYSINYEAIYVGSYNAVVYDIQKCGSTSWLMGILVMEGFYSVKDYFAGAINGQTALDKLNTLRFKTVKARNFNYGKVMEKWTRSTKIVTVRNPFARLVSAYNDKLDPKGEGYSSYYNQISKNINVKYRHLRQNPVERTANGTWATFEDFVNYLVEADPRSLDYHWANYETIIEPCRHTVDVITKLETIESDVRYMKRRLRMSPEHAKVFFPQQTSRTDDEKVRRAFGSVPKEAAARLYENRKIDFERFGYRKPDWL